jgi:hypothetical protein
MIRIFASFAVITVIISTTAVYSLKQATEDLEQRKREISSDILKDREAIKVLRAEMAYLSRPERLERLSRRHLVLDTPSTDQITSEISELTVREDLQLANLPVDNFQLLLPRQKPDPKNISRDKNINTNSGVVAVVSVTADVKISNQTEQEENQKGQMSLYDRILAKIGN